MSDEVIHRRTPSAALLAMRSERKLLTPVRKQIGRLQGRAAFVEARARSTRSMSVEECAAEVGDIRKGLAAAGNLIAELMLGDLGVGPAEDCRKALVHIEQRLASL